MKKLLSIVLAITLILPCISAFALEAFAESDYEKLWAEKLAYESDRFGEQRYKTAHFDGIEWFYGDFTGEGGSIWGYGYEFLPFTEQGQKLTYVYSEESLGAPGMSFSQFLHIDHNLEYSYRCIELLDIVKDCRKEYSKTATVYKSEYREIVQALGITAEELREAYRKMNEEPEYARNVLTELSDEQFEDYKEFLEAYKVPENFIIEAACMKDEQKAHDLVTRPGTVYVKELGYAINAKDIFCYYGIPLEDVLAFNLTTKGFSLMVEDIKAYFTRENNFFDTWGSPDAQGRTPRERFDLFVAEYEKQMAQAPSTGEALYLIPVAIVSLTLGALVIYPRRRKIDNI